MQAEAAQGSTQKGERAELPFSREEVEGHPLFVLVRNAMVEAALTGIVPPEVIEEQMLPLPEEEPSGARSPELDEAMLKLLRLQQGFIREHKEVHRLCEEATAASFHSISRVTGDEPCLVPSSSLQEPVSARMPPIRQTAPAASSPLASQLSPFRMDLPRISGSKRPMASFGQYYPNQTEVSVSNRGDVGQPKSKKRKNFGLDPGGADVLRSWVIRNWKRPYPSEATKTNLVMATGFTRVQVNNWFINARRRWIKKLSPDELERMARELEEQEAVVDASSPRVHGARQGTVTPSAVFRSSESDEESEIEQSAQWYGQRPRREREYERMEHSYPVSNMYSRTGLELPSLLCTQSSSWPPPPLPIVPPVSEERMHEDHPALPTRLPVPEALLTRKEKESS